VLPSGAAIARYQVNRAWPKTIGPFELVSIPTHIVEQQNTYRTDDGTKIRETISNDKKPVRS
jgi:hypothetical protein